MIKLTFFSNRLKCESSQPVNIVCFSIIFWKLESHCYVVVKLILIIFAEKGAAEQYVKGQHKPHRPW